MAAQLQELVTARRGLGWSAWSWPDDPAAVASKDTPQGERGVRRSSGGYQLTLWGELVESTFRSHRPPVSRADLPEQ
jgi:hypothetical protein